MTAVAIILTLFLSIVIYYIYSIFFSFVIGIASSYDYRYGEGIGALILLIILPYGLAFFGASLISRRLIPSAEPAGIRYGVIVTIVIFFLLATFGAMASTGRTNTIMIALISVACVIGIVAGTSTAIQPKQGSKQKIPHNS